MCNKLSNLSIDFPVETAKCIRLLSETNDHWYLSRTNILENIISSIISSENEDAINMVYETIDHLLARGFSNYDSLINDHEQSE